MFGRVRSRVDLFSGLQLGPGIAESIKAGLSSNNSLFTLRLGWCALGDEGVSSVCVGETKKHCVNGAFHP